MGAASKHTFSRAKNVTTALLPQDFGSFCIKPVRDHAGIACRAIDVTWADTASRSGLSHSERCWASEFSYLGSYFSQPHSAAVVRPECRLS